MLFKEIKYYHNNIINNNIQIESMYQIIINIKKLYKFGFNLINFLYDYF